MIGKVEKQILDFLETPATLDLLEEEFSPRRKADATHWASRERHKLRGILKRMIEKKLIRTFHGLFIKVKR